MPYVGKRPEDGFREYKPQNEAGIPADVSRDPFAYISKNLRTDPPMSVPTPRGDPLSASNALSPPDEPPLDILLL